MSDSHKDIQGVEAQQKIKELISHTRTCQMQTALKDEPIATRPMGLHAMDEDGKLHFLSHRQSNKNAELRVSPKMQITITNDSDSEYLTLFGEAIIYHDQKMIDELYSSFANNWFDGKDDPNISVIEFTPQEGHYWDTKHGKIVQYAGMLAGAITGTNKSDGIEGKISL